MPQSSVLEKHVPTTSVHAIPKTKVQRDSTVDILRGFAVFTMVAANMAGNILKEPHPFLFRFYGTFAAPMFIMLAGYMVATKGKQDHGFSYYLLRGALLVLTASLIDTLVWQYYPLVSFDVLYLIGVSMPIAYLVSRLPKLLQWSTMFLFFALTPLVQAKLGYNPSQTNLDIPLGQLSTSDFLVQLPIIVRHFVADGWFPLFPWVGFSLLGVNLSSLRQQLKQTFTPTMQWVGPLILLAGAVFWWFNPGPLYTREGYSELFYPPTFGYMATAMGVILSAFGLFSKISTAPFLKPWKLLGQCSLFIYVLHYTLIRYVLSFFWPKIEFLPFVGLYVAFISVLFGVAYGVHKFKQHSPKNPFLLQFLIGG
jgi:uncharacterized membrane protein